MADSKRSVYFLVAVGVFFLFTRARFGIASMSPALDLATGEAVARDRAVSAIVPDIFANAIDPDITASAALIEDTRSGDALWINTECFISQAMMEEILGARRQGESAVRFPTLSATWNARAGSEGRALSDAGKKTLRVALPHHAPASGLIMDALFSISSEPGEVREIILLGPNHGNKGKASMTTYAGWLTPYGNVSPDKELIDILTARGLAARSDQEFLAEHSIGVLMPWLAYYFPEANVTPLMFHYKYPTRKLDGIFATLAPWLDRGALLIVSADFSHNHKRDEAVLYDKETIRLLEQNDWRAIAGLGSDYLDSPTLLAALMKDSAGRGLEGPKILANTNSGFLMGNPADEITSYIVLTYMEK